MPLLAVNHHYYRDNGTGRGIYPTTPERMKANLDALLAHGWALGGVRDIMRYTQEGSLPAKTCVITFDDGLKEQMRCLSLLESYGAGGMFFVSTAPRVNGRVLDVHKMHMVRMHLSDEDIARDLGVRFGFNEYPFDEAVLVLQYRYDELLSRKVKYFLNFVLDAEQKDAWVSTAFTNLFADEAGVARELYMDADDWALLAKKSCLGTHSHAHLPLATLTPAQIRADIEASLSVIKDAIGAQVQGIAYPFGGKTAVSQEVFAAAGACGLAYGFTMQRALNANGEGQAAPMALNRIDVNDLPGYLS